MNLRRFQASCSDSGGRIVGRRLASMVLPAPGGQLKWHCGRRSGNLQGPLDVLLSFYVGKINSKSYCESKNSSRVFTFMAAGFARRFQKIQ
jgi:hypothetical protein